MTGGRGQIEQVREIDEVADGDDGHGMIRLALEDVAIEQRGILGIGG